MGIGKTLSDILSEKNSNPNELAEKIGVAPSTIYSIIKRDNMKVDITVLASICKQLNVKMERFYNEYVNNIENNFDNAFHLSEHEKQVITAYRAQTNMQPAVDKLLGIDDKNNQQLIPTLVAARSKNNDEPIHIENVPDLSKFPTDDTEL